MATDDHFATSSTWDLLTFGQETATDDSGSAKRRDVTRKIVAAEELLRRHAEEVRSRHPSARMAASAAIAERITTPVVARPASATPTLTFDDLCAAIVCSLYMVVGGGLIANLSPRSWTQPLACGMLALGALCAIAPSLVCWCERIIPGRKPAGTRSEHLAVRLVAFVVLIEGFRLLTAV